MTIVSCKTLFCKEGFVLEPPTDADFAEVDREDAKQSKLDALREKGLAAAAKKRGKNKDIALADLEADLGDLEAAE